MRELDPIEHERRHTKGEDAIEGLQEDVAFLMPNMRSALSELQVLRSWRTFAMWLAPLVIATIAIIANAVEHVTGAK